MRHSTVFVGLDYHQDQVQVCVLDVTGQVLRNGRCGNDAAKIVAAVAAAEPAATVQAAIEASTGSADLADQLIQGFGWQVHQAHARYVAKLKQSPDKTDFSDARLLADLLRVGYLPRTWLPPRPVRQLRRLISYRQSLANQRRACKLRVQAIRREHRIQDAPANAWTKLWIAWLREHPDLDAVSRWLIQEHLAEMASLDRRIQSVEAQMQDLTADDPLVAKLLTEPGIGEVTAWALRASIGRFDRFHSAKALCRYCGLSPRNASSGSRQADAGLIDAADRQLRALLIQAAHRLKRNVDRWAQMAKTLKQRGKPNNVATVAIANRWMRDLYHRMKHEPTTTPPGPPQNTPATGAASPAPPKPRANRKHKTTATPPHATAAAPA